jgi:NHL repeat
VSVSEHGECAYKINIYKKDTVAGNGSAGNKDGTGSNATFNSPNDITINQKTGDVYVSDLGNHCLRKVSPQGISPPQ